jgi:hypothetical protein
MQLTPEILRAAYNYLSETEPFNKWNLPDGEDIGFKVTKPAKGTGRAMGCTHCIIHDPGDRCEFSIDISENHHHHTASLMLTLAHEMIHVHQRHNCVNRGKNSHDAAFKKYALEVCASHGFDPGQF